MYIKVPCVCGCRYGFDVVPVDGQMPVEVKCPRCGLDGTHKADALIAMVMPRPVAAPAAPGVLPGIPLPDDDTGLPAAPVAIALPPSAPPAVALPPSPPPAIALPPSPRSPAVALPPTPAPAAALPPPPTPPPPASGLSVKRRAPEAPPPAAPAAAPAATAEPAASGGLKVKGGAPSAHEPASQSNNTNTEALPAEAKLDLDPHVRIGYMPKDGPEPNFPLGMAGSFAGALVGALIWYAIYHFAEIDFPWLAFVPAVLAGMTGRKLAREDNHWIGVVAVVFTLMAIFGTRYAIATKGMGKATASLDAGSLLPTYDERMKEAKEAVAAKTDDEIRNFLQNRNRRQFEKFAEKGEKYEPSGISNDEIQLFKSFELKSLQQFANGNPSREEYEKQIEGLKSTGTWIARLTTAFTVIIFTGIFGIFSLIGASVVAYRTGSG